MKIIITKNYEQMSVKAAEIVADIVKHNPSGVIGFATGSSPIGLYQNLIKQYQEGKISFKQIKTVNLDEYVGLPANHIQSYSYFMRSNLFDKIDVDKANTNIPNGCAENLQKECARYSAVLAKFRQDVQILGIGSNGHIGFNEPGTAFDSKTHIVDLTENTIKDNSRLFENESQVPRQALTMGISEIMNAKKIVIVANGANKAEAVYKMSKGKISESCPASILQKHPDCTLIIDEAAAKLLN